KVRMSGDSITAEGFLPSALRGAKRVEVSATVVSGGDQPRVVEQLPPHTVRWPGIPSPEVHFSAVTRMDGPFTVVYEAFHYLALPSPQNLACTIITARCDKSDSLACCSDFRADQQDTSAPSDGPGAKVTGIGQTQHDLARYCSQGRFQLGYQSPVYVESNEMQEGPPAGAPAGGV